MRRRTVSLLLAVLALELAACGEARDDEAVEGTLEVRDPGDGERRVELDL